MQKTFSYNTSSQYYLILIYIITSIFLVSLPTIYSSSEAREVHIASYIYNNNEWIMPLRNGIIPSKPPFYHWCVAILGTLFNSVSVHLARVVSVIFGGVFLLYTYLLAKFLDQKNSFSDQTALFATIATSSMYLFFNLAGNCRVDMTFSALFLGSFYYGLRAIFNEEKSSWFLMMIAVAVAILAKGPLGVVLPTMTLSVVIATFCSKKSFLNKSLLLITTLILATLISSIWYYLGYLKAGDEFLNKHLFFENLERLKGGSNTNNQPWYYYITVFFEGLFPWSFIFILCKPWQFSKFSKSEKILLIWLIIPLLFFSVASGKRASYILPVIPSVAIWIALKKDQLFKKSSACYISILFKILIFLAIIIWILIFWFIGDQIFFLKPQDNLVKEILYKFRFNLNLILLITVISASLGLTLLNIPQTHKNNRLNCVGYINFCKILFLVSLYTFLFGIFNFGLAVKGELKGFKSSADKIILVVNKIEAKDNKKVKLLLLKKPREEYFDPILFYLQKEVEIFTNPKPLSLSLEEYSSKYKTLLFLRELDYYLLKKHDSWNSQVILSLNEPYYDAKNKKDNTLILVEVAFK